MLCMYERPHTEFGRSGKVFMFEDRVEAIIKEEVSKAMSGIVTQEGIEQAVSKAVTSALKSFARKQELAAQAYVSEKEAGELFPIAAATLKSWRMRKIPGPPYSKVGDRIVYKLSDLHEFFDRRKI